MGHKWLCGYWHCSLQQGGTGIEFGPVWSLLGLPQVFLVTPTAQDIQMETVQ